MGFFLTAVVFIAVLAVCARLLDGPMFRRLAEHDAKNAATAAADLVPLAIAQPGAVCEVAGRITRISARPREDPSGLLVSVDDGNAVVDVRLPSSTVGFVHTGELLSVTGVLVQAGDAPRIEPLEAALVGEAGWSIQLPLAAGAVAF
jgi:hypothetical protein